MPKQPNSAILKVVAHHNGPTGLSNALNGQPVYQQIQAWVKRGWAAPRYFLNLQPLLPAGVTIQDLQNDFDRAHAKKGARRRPSAPTKKAPALAGVGRA